MFTRPLAVSFRFREFRLGEFPGEKSRLEIRIKIKIKLQLKHPRTLSGAFFLLPPPPTLRQTKHFDKSSSSVPRVELDAVIIFSRREKPNSIVVTAVTYWPYLLEAEEPKGKCEFD